MNALQTQIEKIPFAFDPLRDMLLATLGENEDGYIMDDFDLNKVGLVLPVENLQPGQLQVWFYRRSAAIDLAGYDVTSASVPDEAVFLGIVAELNFKPMDEPDVDQSGTVEDLAHTYACRIMERVLADELHHAPMQFINRFFEELAKSPFLGYESLYRSHPDPLFHSRYRWGNLTLTIQLRENRVFAV